MSNTPAANEFTITRMYDAPVHLVWEAWTDPEKVKHWWGPRGFTLTHHSKDLRVGGHWHYTMHGPDGTDYPNKTVYYEVEVGKRLVYDHGASDDRPPLFRVTVTFEEIGTQTKMQMTMACPTPEEAIQTQAFIKKAGGNGTWDRLAEYLAEEKGETVFVLTRSFAAPIATLFEMWQNPTHVAQWMGPVGSQLVFIEGVIAEGHTTFYKMSFDTADLVMYGKCTYRCVDPPRYLEYSQVFCDDTGAVSRHPLAPLWPEQMRTRVFFAPEGPTASRLTVVWQPEGNLRPEELAAFMDMRAGMTQGWTGSLDKLEDCLAALSSKS